MPEKSFYYKMFMLTKKEKKLNLPNCKHYKMTV